MGLFDNSYVYAAPMPPWSDPWPHPFPSPGPITPERARVIIDRAILVLDEFEVMREIEALPDDARRRIFAWLKARLDMTP